RGQPGDHHGARRRRDRRAGWLRRAGLRGGSGSRPQRVRARRDRLARDPRTGDRARPGHAGDTQEGGGPRMSTPTKEGFMSNRWRLARVLVVACVVAGLGALGVAGGATARSAKCGSLTMDENAWAGATANV